MAVSEETGEAPPWKTWLIVAAVVACAAILALALALGLGALVLRRVGPPPSPPPSSENR